MFGFSFGFHCLAFSRISIISKFSRISRKWTFLKRPLFQKIDLNDILTLV